MNEDDFSRMFSEPGMPKGDIIKHATEILADSRDRAINRLLWPEDLETLKAIEELFSSPPLTPERLGEITHNAQSPNDLAMGIYEEIFSHLRDDAFRPKARNLFHEAVSIYMRFHEIP